MRVTREHLDPHDIPDDAGASTTAAFIGEDVARQLVVRLTLFVALLGVLAGAATDADQGVRTAAVVVGLVGVLALLVSALGRWRRTRQWVLTLVVLVASGSLLAVMLVQQSST